MSDKSLTDLTISEWRYNNLVHHEGEHIGNYRAIIVHFIKEWQQQYAYPIRLGSSDAWRLIEHYVNTKLLDRGIVFGGKPGSIWIASHGTAMYWGWRDQFHDSITLPSLSDILKNYYA